MKKIALKQTNLQIGTILFAFCPDCSQQVYDVLQIGPGCVLLDCEPSPKGEWVLTVDGRAGRLGEASAYAYRKDGRLWREHECPKV